MPVWYALRDVGDAPGALAGRRNPRPWQNEKGTRTLIASWCRAMGVPEWETLILWQLCGS